MKKVLGLLLAMVLMVGMSTMIQARTDNNGAGCGVGQRTFRGDKGLGNHLGAWLVNVIVGGQTFSMSTQTSGCQTDKVVLRDKEQEVFVAANLDQLSQEMAQGNGDYLRALSTLMGCSTMVYGDFAGMTQRKYDVLFPAADTGTLDLLNGLRREMVTHPALSAACTRIS